MLSASLGRAQRFLSTLGIMSKHFRYLDHEAFETEKFWTLDLRVLVHSVAADVTIASCEKRCDFSRRVTLTHVEALCESIVLIFTQNVEAGEIVRSTPRRFSLGSWPTLRQVKKPLSLRFIRCIFA